jgi:hypothetical protein
LLGRQIGVRRALAGHGLDGPRPPLAGGDRPECGFGCVRGRARAGRIAAAAGRDRRDGEQGDEHHRANDHAGQYADQPPIVIQVWPNER